MRSHGNYRENQTVFQLSKALAFFLLFTYVLVFQTACVQINTQDAEIQQHVLPVPDSQQLPDVIKALLKQSDEQYLNSDLNAALATLERAVRIDPGHAEVWSRMAQIYFKKNQFEQARQYAQRSNSVVKNNTPLRNFNNNLSKSKTEN